MLPTYFCLTRVQNDLSEKLHSSNGTFKGTIKILVDRLVPICLIGHKKGFATRSVGFLVRGNFFATYLFNKL